MEWLKNLWKQIIESDNQKYVDKIKELELQNNKVISEYEDLFQKFADTNHLLSENVFKINELEQEIKDLVKHKKTIFITDVLKPKNIAYKWKPDKNTLLRHSLNSFSTDAEYRAKYLNFLIQAGMKDSYASEYELVLDVYLRAKSFVYGDSDAYDSDMESFGVNEYWLTPQEAFDYYVLNNDEGDCEDTSAFIYGCLVTSLLHFGYSIDNLFRADVNIIGREGHAILQWWSGEQFISLESTFAPGRAYKVISSKRDITKSVYTDVMRFFNEKQEYVLK